MDSNITSEQPEPTVSEEPVNLTVETPALQIEQQLKQESMSQPAFSPFSAPKNNGKIIFKVITAVVLIIGGSAGVFMWLNNQSRNQNVNDAIQLVETDENIDATKLEGLDSPDKIGDLENKDDNSNIEASKPETSETITTEPDTPLTTDDSADAEDEPITITDKEQADIYRAQGVEALHADDIEKAKILFTQARQYYQLAGDTYNVVEMDAQLYLISH